MGDLDEDDTITISLLDIQNNIYMAAVGYGISTDVEKSEYTLTPSIEKAVLWRSVPEYAGNIVVFVKTDTDKLHSLAEFDVISLRDVSKYLLELFIHDTNTLIEIKSTLSFSKKSTFPTVYSERAVKQLTEISRLLDEGYRACYILVSLNPSVKEITINSEIEDYYKEFMKCIEKGMTYCAFSIRLHEQTPELYAKIKITI